MRGTAQGHHLGHGEGEFGRGFLSDHVCAVPRAVIPVGGREGDEGADISSRPAVFERGGWGADDCEESLGAAMMEPNPSANVSGGVLGSDVSATACDGGA